MKIQAFDFENKQPLANQKIQLQVSGKGSGLLSFTTDANGFFQLDDQYKGQQIRPSFEGTLGMPITAMEGAKLNLEIGAKEKVK